MKWWRGETDEDNGTSGENTQDDAVLDLQNSILRLMEEGSLPLSSVPPEHQKAYKKCRKAYIEKVLIAKVRRSNQIIRSSFCKLLTIFLFICIT